MHTPELKPDKFLEVPIKSPKSLCSWSMEKSSYKFLDKPQLASLDHSTPLKYKSFQLLISTILGNSTKQKPPALPHTRISVTLA